MNTGTRLLDVIAARRDLTRRQLRTLLHFYVAAAVIIFAVGLITGDPKTIVLSTANLAAWFVFFFLLRTDRLEASGFLVCLVLLATATYSTWTSDFGLLDSTTILFSLVTVFAVLLLQRPLLLTVLALTVADIFIIGFRDRLGLVERTGLAPIIPVDVFVVAVVVAMLALAVRRQYNLQWRALTTALLQEQALQLQADQLQASERRWRTLVHAAPEWVLQIDAEAVIRFTNRSERSGHADDLGRPLTDLVEPDERNAVTRAMDEALAGRRPPPLEVSLVLDGQRRHCVMNLGPLSGPEGASGAIVLISDETDRRHLQMQLEQAQRLDSLGRLAGGIAHDFNNLLTVISGHVDLAASSASLPAELVDDLEAIRIACGRASKLTGQILAFGRQQPRQAEALQINDTVEHLVPMLCRLLGDGLDLSLDLAPDLPPVVGDTGQIEQIVVNLVVNARDAVREADRRNQTPAGQGRSISIRTGMLPPEDAGDGDWMDEPLTDAGVVLVVEDTGTGMESSVRRRAFEPFFSTKPKGEGSGLGLAMVYGIVKQNRGAIRVDSTPGAGTAIAVALPARPDLAAATGSLVPPDASAAAPGGGGETILLVEDNDAVRELTRRMLETYGYRVIECGGLEEALAAAARHADLAAVVTDITMPGGSGLELAEKLPAHLPVLFTSGYASDTSRAAVGRIPEGCFLQKPFTPEDLAAAVRALLDRERAEDADQRRG